MQLRDFQTLQSLKFIKRTISPSKITKRLIADLGFLSLPTVHAATSPNNFPFTNNEITLVGNMAATTIRRRKTEGDI